LIYGFPVGNYFVEYADGTKEELKLRDGQNIHWLDGHPFYRATNDCRYTDVVKDKLGNDLFLYQWEWVNPHPDKKITKVIFSHDNVLDVKTMLFAITGRLVRKSVKKY
jgi:hypothetical protein